jgi:monoamine oxidase
MPPAVSRSPLRTPADHVDVAIIGAGAAGIAAARRCVAAGLSVAVLEARDRVGGRAVTTSFGGHPIDLGAHWLHAGALNPLVRLGRARGEMLRRAPPESHLIVNGRPASARERATQGPGFERMDRAIAEAARSEQDVPVSRVAPMLGQWGRSTGATFALISGRPLAEVSAQDFPSDEFGDNHFVHGGYGAFLARLAAGLPIALGTAVRTIDWSGSGVAIETERGRVQARLAILTVPVPVLQAGTIRFRPALPQPTGDAVSGFLAGTYEHVVLNWPDAPFQGPDRLAKLVGRRWDVGMMTRIDGAPFHYLELDHRTAAGLAGPDEAARFARERLREHFGARALARLRIPYVTEWRRDPWSRCAWAVVPPGRREDRAILAEPIGQRIWIAGEATSRGQWGTAGGAWEEGERAAERVVMAVLGRTPADRVPSAAE